MGSSMTRRTRGQYTVAGISSDQYNSDGELYISREIPGSARERLRDLPFADQQGQSPEPVRFSTAHRKQVSKQQGLLDRFLWEYRRDRLSAVLCLFLLIMVLVLGAVYAQKRSQVRSELLAIQSFKESEMFFLNENEKLTAQLERARDGARIRNLAQNSLGMLRPELADVQEIYIQIPEDDGKDEITQSADTKVEMLDLVLNLMRRLHIQ